MYRNFKYTNPALRQNQSFSMFPYTTGTALTQETAAASSHFDLSTSTALTKPPLPNTADHTILLYAKTQKLSISGNHPAGYMNRTTWAPQSSPPYSLLALPRSRWDTNQLVPYIPISRSPDSETWVDIIINNLDDGAHPFHLHGYSFYVVASYRSEHGWGSYNPFSNLGHEPNLNVVDPVRKDTVSVPRRGYVIIRFKADNEGIWMLHCHVLFHQASGMAMGIHVGSDEAHEDFDIRAKELCANPAQ
jgi:FtsP/CotA-like multicopper oxidase with cupredoxin domain